MTDGKSPDERRYDKTCPAGIPILRVVLKVREIGADLLPRLFEKNPYMNEIYPDAASRTALTVFQIYEGILA